MNKPSIPIDDKKKLDDFSSSLKENLHSKEEEAKKKKAKKEKDAGASGVEESGEVKLGGE